MRKALITGTIAGMAMAVGFAVPAFADPGDTPVTVEVGATTGLTIDVPTDTLALGGRTLLPGQTTSGQLGTVTVTDSRSAIDTSWTASVVAAGFAGTTNPTQSIPLADVLYWSGTPRPSSPHRSAAFLSSRRGSPVRRSTSPTLCRWTRPKLLSVTPAAGPTR